MSEDGLLKRAAAYSSLLMLIAILFSTGLAADKNKISYAQVPDVSLTPEPTSAVQTPALPAKEELALPVTVWDSIVGLKESPVFSELSDQVIVIAKPDSLNAEAMAVFEDIYIERQVKLMISGITNKEFAFGSIYRVMQEDIFDKPLPTPSPTPTPTPKPKNPTAIPTMEPQSTTGEGHSNDMEEQREEEEKTDKPRDPAVSFVSSYSSNEEDDTLTAVLKLNLDRTYVYEFLEDEAYYYICLKRPKDVYEKIVVVDAGHGGLDSGTYSPGYKYLEKDMNLSMLLYLKEIMDQSEDIKVYYTRTTDCRLNLNQRVNLANDLEADFFVSFHCNANTAKGVNGTEVLYNDKQNTWRGMNSRRFSNILQKEISDATGLFNRGIVPRSHNVYIVGEAKMPVALIEVAFMSNEKDLAVLIKEETRKRVAQKTYESILQAYRERDEMAAVQ